MTGSATGPSALLRRVAAIRAAGEAAGPFAEAAAGVAAAIPARLLVIPPTGEPLAFGDRTIGPADPAEVTGRVDHDDVAATADGFAGRLTGGTRFVALTSSTVDTVDTVDSVDTMDTGDTVSTVDTADMDRDERLALAATVRAALLGHTGADPDERLAAEREAGRRLDAVLLARSAALEGMVTDQQAEGRLVDTLRVVGQRLTAQLDLDSLVQDATDAATAATGARFGAFFYNLVDAYGESYTLFTLSGAPRSAFERFPMPRNTAVFSPTFNGEGTVRSDDITADPRFGHNPPYRGMPEGHLPVRSYLAVPVISPTSREVLGGFFFGHERIGVFGPNHARLAEGIAGYAAVALDNARLYARERNLATELQRSMLPAIGAIPGFTVVGRYLPAATGSEVGGDWLDVIELAGGRTAFVIGDVMGRGVLAATTMGQMRTAVRAYAMLDLPPGDVLRHASQLAGAISDRQFVTCLYAVHDPVDQTLTFGNAGHPPPIVIEPGGEVRVLRERLGMPLRVGESFVERRVPFPAGSALALYTDGLVERRGRTLAEGVAVLAEALRETVGPHGADPEAACDKVIQELTGGDHDDDVALLYARDGGAERRVAVMGLGADLAVAGQARRFTADTLDGWGLSDPERTTAIVVTELVSNAVRHSQEPLALRLLHHDGRVVVEVLDADDRPPRAFQPAIHDEHHRGLFLVERLSERWGSRPAAGGKVVWAELTLPGRRS